MQEVRDAATARDVELRDRLIQLKRELQEEEKELRLWQEQRQQEYRDLRDQLRLTRAQVIVCIAMHATPCEWMPTARVA